MKLSASLLSLLLLPVIVAAQTGSPEIQKRLTALQQSYDAAVQRQVAPSHESAVKTLNAKYTAALDRFITSSTQAGKLEDAIALRDEKKRVTDALPLPETDADAPEALRPLRSTYRQQLSALEESRDKALAPLKKRYQEELTKLQTETTKAGKLEDALAVKAVVDGLNPEANPSPAPASSGDKLVVARGSGKTDPKAAQAICEWALANGGIVITSVGVVGLDQELRVPPRGSYKVIGIRMSEPGGDFPWELLGELGELATLDFKFSNPPAPEKYRNLSSLQHLNELYFHDPLKPIPLTKEQASMLPAIPSLTQLQFTADGKLLDVLPLLIERFPSIRELHLYGVLDHELTESMRLLLQWPQIVDLRLQCNLTVEASMQISKLPDLREVMFYTGSYKLDPNALTHLTSMEVLQLNGRTDSTDLIPAISTIKNLKRVQLAMEGQPAESVAKMISLPNLRSLTLTKMAQGMDEVSRLVSGINELEELGMITGDLGDKGAEFISNMKHLKSLNITGTQVSDVGLLMLAKLKDLTDLTVTGTQVTEVGIKAFKKSRPRCHLIN